MVDAAMGKGSIRVAQAIRRELIGARFYAIQIVSGVIQITSTITFPSGDPACWEDMLRRVWETLGRWCHDAGLGDGPRKIFAELEQISLVDVILPTRTGIKIRKRCVSRPTEHQAILLSDSAWNCPPASNLQICSEDFTIPAL
jgi:hypothetical protein